MNWFQYCLLTIVLYSIHDTTLKYLAGNVHSVLASIIINGSAALVLAVFLFFQTDVRQVLSSTPVWSTNTFFLVLAGVSLGIATITFMNAFAANAQLSIAVPVVYAGVILLCLLLGLAFFGESLSWKQWMGACLAIAGIYLMSVSN